MFSQYNQFNTSIKSTALGSDMSNVIALFAFIPCQQKGAALCSQSHKMRIFHTEKITTLSTIYLNSWLKKKGHYKT